MFDSCVSVGVQFSTLSCVSLFSDVTCLFQHISNFGEYELQLRSLAYQIAISPAWAHSVDTVIILNTICFAIRFSSEPSTFSTAMEVLNYCFTWF